MNVKHGVINEAEEKSLDTMEMSCSRRMERNEIRWQWFEDVDEKSSET